MTRRTILLLPAILALAWCTGCAPHQQFVKEPTPAFDRHRHERIAASVEVNGRVSEPCVLAVRNAAMDALSRRGYRVIAVSDRGLAQAELARQHVGQTDPNAAEPGRNLNAGALMVVTINAASVSSEQKQFDCKRVYFVNGPKGKPRMVEEPYVEYRTIYTAHVFVSARLVDSSTQELLWTYSGRNESEVSEPSGLQVALSEVTGSVLNAFPARNVGVAPAQ